MKESHAGIDVAAAEPALGRASTRLPRAPVRGRGRARRRPQTPHAGSRFVGGLLLMVALTAGAFGVEGLIQASHERSSVAALQAQVTSLTQRLSADEHGAASERAEVGKVAGRASGVARSVSRSLARINWSLQSVPSESQLAVLRNAVDAYAACVGELQSELSGLGIDWRIDPEKPSSDYFKLFTGGRVSASCSAP
ncbi:MAG TPA: hypothetical protein VMF57_15565 [Solirubrobacteraceae bacterium]|nr:hypothetical protein [Solirubrobacteraceae bacterium]